MDIKITIENLNDILKSVDQLAEATALVGTAISFKNNRKENAKAAAAIINEINKEEKAAESEPEETTDPEEKVTEPEEKWSEVAEGPPAVTIEDVRELFVTKNSIKGNTAKLKAILDEFGVKKVTDLEEKDFPDVLEKLGAL